VIAPAAAFATCLILACLRMGSPWTAIAALILGGVLLAVGADRQLRRAARALDRIFRAELAKRPAVPPRARPAAGGTPPEAVTAMITDLDGDCEWCQPPADGRPVGDPRDCRCTVKCQGIDWCNASGWTTAMIPAVTEGGDRG